MKNQKTTTKKLTLKKIQVAKLKNMNIIKGGSINDGTASKIFGVIC